MKLLHLGIAAVVSALVLFARASGLESAIPFIEALLAGLIVYTILQLVLAKSTLESANQVLGILRSAEEELKGAKAELTIVRGALTPFVNSLQSQTDSLGHRCDDMRRAMELTIDLLGRVPKLESITGTLNSADTLQIGSLLAKSFGDYGNSWSSLAERLKVGSERAVAFGWTSFLTTYLQSMTPRLGVPSNGEMHATSEIYTKIVLACSTKLLELFPDSAMTLFLVTAMLPADFYNWPQAEYVRGSQFPEYIGHTWSGAESYFANMRVLKNRMTVKRCILVRSGPSGVGQDGIPQFVHSVSDLQASAGLEIAAQLPLMYDELASSGMQEMFATTAKARDPHFDHGKTFIDIDHFRFYPVGSPEQFSECEVRSSGKLLGEFIDSLHSSPDGARYYPLASHDRGFLRLLFRDQIRTPELAMFRIDRPGDPEPGGDWLFGVHGYLFPFSEAMRIRFVSGEALAAYTETLAALEGSSNHLSTLGE